jgi:ribosomal protein L11 methylase PrmA
MSLFLEQSSFRDRDGYIFYKNGEVFRNILFSYQNTWENLENSQFFKELISSGKLISYENCESQTDSGVYKTIKPTKLPFISYPSEWTFSQLKKAALLTLSIQKAAIKNGFSLKDASAYNVQFIGGRAIFIDILSFEPYENGKPWQAYKQFCSHFLGPLLLSYYGHPELKTLSLNYLDGIPLDLCSKLLPFKSRFNLVAYTHVHLHARFEKKHSEDTKLNTTKLQISKERSLSIIEHLESGIKNLNTSKNKTNWTDYYATCSYSNSGLSTKKMFIESCLKKHKGELCVDLGANTGEFSKLASSYFSTVIACDSDVEVVTKIQNEKVKNITALHVDLTNPTPSYGWNNLERKSFIERINKADFTLALALIHHLCIGNNVPLAKVAEFFANCSQKLIIEFVPKTDIQVAKLLVTKKDVFADYTLETFMNSFNKYFNLLEQQSIPDSDRVLFFLSKK